MTSAIDRRGGMGAVIANYRSAMDLLGRYAGDPRSAARRFGSVEAVSLGHEVAFYNAVLALDAQAALEDVLRAVDWIESLGLPPSVHVADAANRAIPDALAVRGFQPQDRMPAMALDPIPTVLDTPIDPSAAVRTGGAELAEAWYHALETGERFRRTFSPELAADRAVRIAVVELDGEPVAGAMAIGSDDGVLGVYAVATMERARRRGLGRAVTWAAIRAGVDAWGSEIAVLEASELGVPLYRAMGFAEVGSVTVFSPPDADPASPAATR